VNKSLSCDVSVRLHWPEEDAIQTLKREIGIDSTAGVLRLGLYRLLQDSKPDLAKKLLKARIQIDANTRQRMASIGCFLLTGLVWWQVIHGAGDEMRRPKGIRVKVASVRGVRRNEVGV
jgi:hypothetical protein